jgi:hypothetical protein
MEEAHETMEELKEALADLFLKVKVRSSEEIDQYTSEQMRKEKDELNGITGMTLIEDIKCNVEILLNIKSEEGSVSESQEKSLCYPNFFSGASSIMSWYAKPIFIFVFDPFSNNF